MKISENSVGMAKGIGRINKDVGLAARAAVSVGRLSSVRTEVEPTATSFPPVARVARNSAAVVSFTSYSSACM